MVDRLCLLAVHAHPDDEASKGSGSIAKYHSEGVHTVLVCCTGGEAGEILNPAMDRSEVWANLPAIRQQELERAAEIIGYDELILLGYRDSGMPGTPENEDPRSFARADQNESVERLVAAIRRVRPHVVVTYPEDQESYPHPDHLRVHDITVSAFDAASDPKFAPEAGEPWRPSKLYYLSWSRTRLLAMHHKFLELGLESPFQQWLEFPDDEHRITTRVDVSDYSHIWDDAMLAHATQVDPNSPLWFGLPREVARSLHPFDDYELARSEVPAHLPEDDLFAGIRESVKY